jgi:hypothetical protein
MRQRDNANNAHKKEGMNPKDKESYMLVAIIIVLIFVGYIILSNFQAASELCPGCLVFG